MAAGFITDGFVSAFNPTKTSLFINNVDTGIPVDGYSISPNDSYVIQQTGFGTIKTVWSHLSLSGDVTLYLKDVPEDTANFIDKLCLKQDTNYYVSFLGYMYRTEQIDVTITPTQGSINRLDITLSFYGKLPYSSPIFRPNFSTLYSNEMTRISNFVAYQSMLVPLPGNSAKNREDTVLALIKNSAGSAIARVFSSVKDYSHRSLYYDGPLSSNYDSSSEACLGILNIGDGVDDLVIASLSGSNITVRFIQVKDNVLNESSRPTITINESYVTKVNVTDNKLYAYVDAKGFYKVISYSLTDKNPASTRKVLQDSTTMKSLAYIPPEGSTATAPPAPPITSNCSAYVLDDNKMKLLIPDTLADIKNAYDSYILPKGVLLQIAGADISSFTVEAIRKIDDGRIIVFFRNFKVGTGYVHYAIINFRDYEADRGNWKTAFVTGYRVANVNLGSFKQTFTYLGITQTNTAVIADNKCYMSTEAYTDFYIENNILAITQTSMGFKFFVMQSGSDVVIKCMSK